jgi:hypothetical protein
MESCLLVIAPVLSLVRLLFVASVAKGVFTSNISPALPKIKKRPRGRAFEKGNTLSLPYRFKKGVSGNPGGRPKSKEVNAAAREFLGSDLGNAPKAQTNAEAIVAKIGHRARKGDLGAATFLSDRAEGRPAVSVNIGGGGDNLALILQHIDQKVALLPEPEGNEFVRQAKLREAADEADETAGA